MYHFCTANLLAMDVKPSSSLAPISTLARILAHFVFCTLLSFSFLPVRRYVACCYSVTEFGKSAFFS